ncbi:MAG TPA: DUF2169 domain-containing protein [Helicobacteraceae bacterium]|nr:DUF2169 domain-containing protein [Helicobacteraceae bacterium]
MLPSNDVGQWILLTGQTPKGEHILSLLLKRSYKITRNHRCQRAEKDRKLIPADQYYNEPINSSVKFESDFIPWKIATDVVFNATAYAPNEQTAQQIIASVMIGKHRKDLLITGHRIAHYQPNKPPLFSEPEPFLTIPLTYENAYGGVDVYSDPETSCAYIRNPIGKGFAIKNTATSINQLALPNIECIDDQLTPERLVTEHFMHWENQPLPDGFAWFAKNWQPRSQYAGIMPADRPTEQELRAAYSKFIPEEQQLLYQQTTLPDMDFRFFNGASSNLALPYLQGDETIKTRHITPYGDYMFQLPNDKPQIILDIGNGIQQPESILHTVMVHLDDYEVDLTWRAAIHYSGMDWLPMMKKFTLHIE